MLGLHIAISPLYLMIALGLIARLRPFHIAIRLVIALSISLVVIALITIIGNGPDSFRWLIGPIIGVMSVLSMVLLYPALAKLAPLSVGLPTANHVEVVESIRSPINRRNYISLVIYSSIAALVVGFLLRQLLRPDTLWDLMTFGALGLGGSMLTHRFIAAPLLSSKKVYIGWQRGFQLVCCICVGLLAGWMIASSLQSQEVLESLVYGLCMAIPIPFGVLAWQGMLEGFKHLKR